jgi:hypothetical protein
MKNNLLWKAYKKIKREIYRYYNQLIKLWPAIWMKVIKKRWKTNINNYKMTIKLNNNNNKIYYYNI